MARHSLPQFNGWKRAGVVVRLGLNEGKCPGGTFHLLGMPQSTLSSAIFRREFVILPYTGHVFQIMFSCDCIFVFEVREIE